ncbi:MAG: hypothetical protein KGJ77_10660 [Acidobacteriota bacterium]|nr:hypothetical protein [Acidobacteriota bacterium]
MTLDEAADELYRLPLPEFTTTRDARAAEAARAGDRELSAAIKKLRKPTTGAWLANLLAHARPDDVGRLIDLGAALRSAQGRLAGDDLRRLSQQRRELVSGLSAEATRLARDAGTAAGEAAVGELEETLEAALSDEAAAEALRSGRLTARLAHAGLGFGGVGTVGERPGPKKAGASARVEAVGGRGGSSASTRRKTGGVDATRLRQAGAVAVEARRRLTSRRAGRERAEREVDRLGSRMEALEEDLRSVRSEAGEARTALRAARAEEQQAEKAERRAEADLRRLER